MSLPFTELEKNWMTRALDLAKSARGMTSPNPMVGAIVISPLGEIIGEGFHPQAGQPHAEVFAVRQAREKVNDLKGCTIYVTLEPCNHHGRTPPCVDLLVTSGISRVVIGALDPNPRMLGSSVEKLRANGLVVDTSLLINECQKLIRGFKTVIQESRPFVTLKCATSLDGKIATSSGESRWITSDESRLVVHRERAEHDAILVGVGTVLADDPQLTVRLQKRHAGLTKIIFDSWLRTPPHAQLLSTPGRVLIYCDSEAPAIKRAKLEQAGAVIVPVKARSLGAGIDLRYALADMAHRGVQELFVEGGAKIHGTFLREKLFDRVLYFLAPRILGSEGRDVFEGLKIHKLSESVDLQPLSMTSLGRDILIEGIKSCSPV